MGNGHKTGTNKGAACLVYKGDQGNDCNRCCHIKGLAATPSTNDWQLCDAQDGRDRLRNRDLV